MENSEKLNPESGEFEAGVPNIRSGETIQVGTITEESLDRAFQWKPKDHPKPPHLTPEMARDEVYRDVLKDRKWTDRDIAEFAASRKPYDENPFHPNYNPKRLSLYRRLRNFIKKLYR